jgi:hypothetical protein
MDISNKPLNINIWRLQLEALFVQLTCNNILVPYIKV